MSYLELPDTKREALISQMKRLKVQGYKPHKCEPINAMLAHNLATDKRK